ncbi:BA75_00308T0 [Komagataella pastoris]|uniref:Protein BFR2 n=1 Tax=Komagataella pastoris TaxID=4922 RepID=A0A1B2J6I4_PICPA|nr:BA75_00308T0 [Komagataella pastoris]
MARKTLAQTLAELSQPASGDFDIEDHERGTVFDDGDNSSSGSESEEDKSNHYVKVGKSKIRDHAVKLGGQYEGTKSSRADVFGNEENKESEDEEDEEVDHSEIDDELSVSGSESESDEINSDQGQSESDSEEESNSDEDLDYKRSKLQQLINSERKTILNQLSTSNKQDALKGFAVLNQQKQYDQLVDLRIKLQKGLVASNGLPINKEYYEQNKALKSSKHLDKLQDKLFSLLDVTLELRGKLLNKSKIVSQEFQPISNKKRNLQHYLEESSKLDNIVNEYRKNVLVKWSQKVQKASGATALSSSKFKAINQDSSTQVDNYLADMDRLIKRTRLNRRSVVPLGYTETEEVVDDDELVDNDKDNNETKYFSNIDRSLKENKYIYDDDDFYRVLLNDLVDKKVSDTQKLTSTSTVITFSKSKLHKSYERKATKGRKLRYTVQDPLLNFEASNPNAYKWNDYQIDEFFASLFGQKVNMNEDEHDEEEQGESEEEGILNDDIKLFG